MPADVEPTRAAAVAAAADAFDSGLFRRRLAELVSIPSTSQDPGHGADLERYLHDGIAPWLRSLGFTVGVHPNEVPYSANDGV